MRISRWGLLPYDPALGVGVEHELFAGGSSAWRLGRESDEPVSGAP